MSGIDDNACSLTWWWEQLSLCDDWNSMPLSERRNLTTKFQQVFIEFIDLNLTKNEVMDLIKLTDPPTVWDAMLALRQNIPNRKTKTKWQLLAYLNKVVVNMWQQQHPTRETPRQPPPQPEKNKKRASKKVVERWNPANFGARHCEGCGRILRRDNDSGVCRCCQRQDNGRECEH